jgi:thioredoxin-related protein
MKIILLLLFIIVTSDINYTYAESPVYLESMVDAVIESNQTNKNLLVIFTADWCKYCKILEKEIKNSDQFENYIICFVDSDTNPELMKEYQISLIPYSIIIQNNIEKKHKLGFLNMKEYLQWMQK